MIEKLVTRSADGKYPTTQDNKEHHMLELMRDINTMTSHIPGSAVAHVNMWNEIRVLMMKVGLLGFFIVVNPSDTCNLIVKFLAGNDIDINALLLEQVPNP